MLGGGLVRSAGGWSAMPMCAITGLPNVRHLKSTGDDTGWGKDLSFKRYGPGMNILRESRINSFFINPSPKKEHMP